LAAVKRLAALGAAWLCLACAPPIRTELREVEDRPVVRAIALAGVQTDPMLSTAVPDDAPAVVSARLAAAIQSETKLRIVAENESDAVLTGLILRYVERQGTATGVRHPASVWFEIELRDRAGAVLWTGTYEETQAALSDDVGSFPRVWERGFRWVTAADLADYGARTLVRELQRDLETWS
jgi:hypothetical protein